MAKRESKHRAICDNNIIYRVNNNTSNLSSDVPEEMSVVYMELLEKDYILVN